MPCQPIGADVVDSKLLKKFYSCKFYDSVHVSSEMISFQTLIAHVKCFMERINIVTAEDCLPGLPCLRSHSSHVKFPFYVESLLDYPSVVINRTVSLYPILLI